MKRLPLFDEDHRVAVEKAPEKDYNPECTDCVHSEGPRSRCLAPKAVRTGEGETLLVVGEWPTTEEDVQGKAFTNAIGQWVRATVESLWKGRIVYTHAIRCAMAMGPKEEPTDKSIEACRGYLTAVLNTVKPSRILMVGRTAGEVILDRRVHPPYVRTGYAYLESGAVAYWMPDPSLAVHNNLYGRDWREDARHALQDPKPPKPPWDAYAQRIESLEDAELAAARIREYASAAHDVETSGGIFTRFFQVDCLGVALTGTAEVYVWGRKALNDPGCVDVLRSVMEDERIQKVAHNAKIEGQSLAEDARLRFKIPTVYVDTLVRRKIGWPENAADLETVAELVGMGGHKERMEKEVERCVDVIKSTREEWDNRERHLPGTLDRCLEAAIAYPNMHPKAIAYGMVVDDERDTYVALDCVTTGFLVARVDQDLQVPGLQTVSEEMARVPRTVSHLERNGILVDKTQILAVADHAERETTRLARQLAMDGLLEPSKKEQVVEYLYGKHDLPCTVFSKKTNQPSVSSEALEKLPQDHTAVKLYSAWMTHETVRTRYGRNLLDFVREDGRIHGQYNANGTDTGRWSSKDPNMQNQMSRGDLAKMVKNIFVAAPGYVFLSADQSQVEYRVAAWLSGDKTWITAFQNGQDLHRRNAELASFAWGIAREVAEAMTDEEIAPYRHKAKAVGFGLLYGKAVFSLARDWGCSEEEAQAVVDAILGNSPELAEWIESQHRFAYANGYVTTTWDGKPARWRPLYGVASDFKGERRSCERKAVNTAVQGSAADIMLRSLNAEVDWLEGDNIPARLVGTVHDSLLLEVREDWVDEVARTTLDIMTQWDLGPVPLKADLEIGRTWGGLEKAKVEGGRVFVKQKGKEKDSVLWVPANEWMAA